MCIDNKATSLPTSMPKVIASKCDVTAQPTDEKKVINDDRMERNDKIHTTVRSPRTNWGKSMEEKIIQLSPYPTSYDINAIQSSAFSEFTYTEYLSGMYLKTQSIEINCRIIEEASKIPAREDHLSRVMEKYGDKYISEQIPSEVNYTMPKKVVFLPGSNLLYAVSGENLARVCFEDDDIVVKLHPLTHEAEIREIGSLVYGMNKVITGQYSAEQLMQDATDVYTTTASELASVAVLNDKEIHNVTNFFVEPNLCYYAISRLLFKEPCKEKRKEMLNNIIDCDTSGIIFEWMDNLDERISKYYKRSIELKNEYRPSFNDGRTIVFNKPKN